MKQDSRRTAHLTAFLACLVVIVALCAKKELAEGAYWALAFLAVPPAMRHSVGDLAAGGGLKGAAKVLFTDAKPEAKP